MTFRRVNGERDGGLSKDDAAGRIVFALARLAAAPDDGREREEQPEESEHRGRGREQRNVLTQKRPARRLIARALKFEAAGGVRALSPRA
jgi:hypothetical protein